MFGFISVRLLRTGTEACVPPLHSCVYYIKIRPPQAHEFAIRSSQAPVTPIAQWRRLASDSLLIRSAGDGRTNKVY